VVALAHQGIYGAVVPVGQALALMTGAGGAAVAAAGLPGGVMVAGAVLLRR
jgi:hypothetical protein